MRLTKAFGGLEACLALSIRSASKVSTSVRNLQEVCTAAPITLQQSYARPGNMHVLMGVQCRGQQVDAFNQQLKSKPLKQRRWTAWRGDTSDIELHPLGAHQQLVPVDSPHEGRGKDARRSQFQRARPSPLRNFAGCSEITCNYISTPCASTLPSRRC